MNFIWATRGFDWGFRFLCDGGHADPLAAYEEAFSAFPDETSLCLTRGTQVALRFPDPEGRTDRAGRVIPHEFVLEPPLSAQVRSEEAGLLVIWPLVKEHYAAIWDGEAAG